MQPKKLKTAIQEKVLSADGKRSILFPKFFFKLRSVFFETGSLLEGNVVFFTIVLKISPCLSRTLYFDRIQEQ
jgi:hypothetical protein